MLVGDIHHLIVLYHSLAPPPVRGGDGEGLSPLEKAGRQL